MKVLHKALALAALTVPLAAGCGAVSSSTSAAPPATHASAAATATCPGGMSPDANGVCQPGGKTPPSPSLAQGSPLASVPGAELTASQQQAVTAAQGYLGDGQGFSYKSLLGQLTSSYGDGFSQADAKFAIGYLHPDWDAQAVLAAKGYLNDGQGFSRASLISQLDSPYGDQFTYDQAVYAVNQVGL